MQSKTLKVVVSTLFLQALSDLLSNWSSHGGVLQADEQAPMGSDWHPAIKLDHRYNYSFDYPRAIWHGLVLTFGRNFAVLAISPMRRNGEPENFHE